MALMVTWDQITAECDGFRAGFVAVYEKYKGQETDEKVSGRTTKVTMASFARHAGIAESTFSKWVKTAAATVVDRRTHTDRTRQSVRRLTEDDQVKVVQELLAANPRVAERALDPTEARDPASTPAKAVGNVAKAMIQARNQNQARTERRQIENPAVKANAEFKSISDLKAALYRHAREVGEALSGVGELDAGEQPFLENALEQSEERNRQVRHYLEHGRTQFDLELQSLLESEK
jgi:hypothetical protein